MLRDGLNQRFLIVVTDTVFPIGHCPRQCKNPVKVGGRAQHENIFVLLQICFHALLQIPFCHHCAIRAGHRRSLGDDGINLADSSVQNLVHGSATHAVQSEVSGIQHALAVGFDEEQIAVRSGVVNAKGCDLNITDQKRFSRRKSLDTFHALAECIIFLTAVPSRY